MGKPTHEVPAGTPRSAALGERTVHLPPAAESEDASPFLSGEAGSDMYNAKSVLMYSRDVTGQRSPRRKEKRGTARYSGKAARREKLRGWTVTAV